MTGMQRLFNLIGIQEIKGIFVGFILAEGLIRFFPVFVDRRHE